MIRSKRYAAYCATGTVVDVRGFTRTKVSSKVSSGAPPGSKPWVSSSVDHTDYVRFVLRHQRPDGTTYDKTFVLAEGDLQFTMGDVISYIYISRSKGKRKLKGREAWSLFFKNKNNGYWYQNNEAISTIAGGYHGYFPYLFFFMLTFFTTNLSLLKLGPSAEALLSFLHIPYDEVFTGILLFFLEPLVFISPWLIFRFFLRKSRKKEMIKLINELRPSC